MVMHRHPVLYDKSVHNTIAKRLAGKTASLFHFSFNAIYTYSLYHFRDYSFDYRISIFSLMISAPCFDIVFIYQNLRYSSQNGKR